ncbi:MAG TPA: aldose epimerase family protein [Rhizomicrobium sp.]|nr:aldose epimerase family protein [Rhizomicrobium sp.]
MKRIWFAAAAALLAATPARAAITVKAWGGVAGKGVDLFTLTNANGMQASITNYGAIITAIGVPGPGGQLTDVVQGFDSLADYTSLDYKGRYGAIIGRFANRIKDNTYQIGHIQYRVARDAYVLNEAENKPYDERVWNAAPRDGDEPQLVLSLIDRNGTMGFPGTLRVTVTYTLTRRNVLRIAYHAVSDKDTIISLTNHSYFNMAGDASGPVLDQLLTINADQITVVDDKNVPTGEMRNVAGTAFDFRQPIPIGAHINDPDPAIQRAHGFDQNFAINGKPGTLRLAARLTDPKSGRTLEEWTTQAGLQVYSANYPPPSVALIKGYRIHSAVALEAQAFPNAPNIPSFPSALLRQDTPYDQVTEFRFTTMPQNPHGD